MSTITFMGIAYWTVSTTVTDWLAKAVDVLMPVERSGLAVLSYECLPGGNQLTVQFGDERHQMLVADGKGRGVVRVSESAALFVVCLVALRKALGDISVVTESRETVPTLPRQNYPIYTDIWPRVLPVAQGLGLASDASFTARNMLLLNNLF